MTSTATETLTFALAGIGADQYRLTVDAAGTTSQSVVDAANVPGIVDALGSLGELDVIWTSTAIVVRTAAAIAAFVPVRRPVTTPLVALEAAAR